jgi:hypothetical protein
MQRKQIVPHAPERDQMFVEALRELIPDEIASCQIACYLRRPDRYAESLYNQHVKRGVIDSTFDEFLPLIEPALSYDRCVYRGLMFSARGTACCESMTPPRRRRRRLRHARAGIRDVSQFSHVHNQANERLARDLLEFKRLKIELRGSPSATLRMQSSVSSTKRLDCVKRSPPLIKIFCHQTSAPALRRLQPEWMPCRHLMTYRRLHRFDAEAAKASWSPYPGLAHERRQDIERHYERINRRLAFRVERTMLDRRAFFGICTRYRVAH